MLRLVSAFSLPGALAGGVLAFAIWGYFVWIRAVLKVPEIPSSQALVEAPLADFDWSLFDLDGSEIPFATFKGKVIFLSFWATWCVPCVVEMPSIQTLKEALAGKDVVFALVANQSQPSEVLRVVHSFDPCLACAVHMVRPDDRAGGSKVLIPPGIA